MSELADTLTGLAQFGVMMGLVALGFGLVLKGVSPKTAVPILRFGGYTAAGSAVIYVVAGSI